MDTTSSSSSTTTSSSTSSSSDDHGNSPAPLPLTDLRRKLQQKADTRSNQQKFCPHEIITIHAELSDGDTADKPIHDAAAEMPRPNDSLFVGKFWNNRALVPSIKTRHAIAKFINSKSKKIDVLEFNSAKKDKLILSQAKKIKKLKKKNKVYKNRIRKLCDFSSDSSS